MAVVCILVVIKAKGCATAVVNIVARCWLWSLGLTAKEVVAISLGYIALVMRGNSKGQEDAGAVGVV